MSLITRRKQAAASEAEQPLLASEPHHHHHHHHQRSHLKEILLLSIPTVFDLAATVLMNVGLLSVTASVYQMMRGAEMLFAAVFAVVFLRRWVSDLLRYLVTHIYSHILA
jgi:drug/metabolite transporter (DMT)-like permease